MHLTRLRKPLPSLNIRRNLLISLDLRPHEFQRLLRQILRQAHNAVQVANDEVAGMDHGFLVLNLQADGRVDLADFDHFVRRRCAYVSREDLCPKGLVGVCVGKFCSRQLWIR